MGVAGLHVCPLARIQLKWYFLLIMPSTRGQFGYFGRDCYSEVGTWYCKDRGSRNSMSIYCICF